MLASFPFLRASEDERAFAAALFGALLAVGNALVAYGLVLWSAGRSSVAFMRAVLGGMLGRMAFLLGAVVFGILLLDLPRLPLIVSLLAHFVAFLGLELYAVQKRALVAGTAR
jgi:hypothetical protein